MGEFGLMVEGTCSFSPHQGSNLHVHACYPHGALHAHQVCRMFSKPWDQSWCAQTGSDTHVNKKKITWTRFLIESPGSLKRRSKKYEIINWNMHNTDAWQHLGFIPGTIVYNQIICLHYATDSKDDTNGEEIQ